MWWKDAHACTFTSFPNRKQTLEKFDYYSNNTIEKNWVFYWLKRTINKIQNIYRLKRRKEDILILYWLLEYFTSFVHVHVDIYNKCFDWVIFLNRVSHISLWKKICKNRLKKTSWLFVLFWKGQSKLQQIERPKSAKQQPKPSITQPSKHSVIVFPLVIAVTVTGAAPIWPSCECGAERRGRPK